MCGRELGWGRVAVMISLCVLVIIYIATLSQLGKAHQVIQLHMTNWAPDGRCSNLTSIVDAIGEMSKIQRRTGNHPILIHCR